MLEIYFKKLRKNGGILAKPNIFSYNEYIFIYGTLIQQPGDLRI